MMLSNKLAKSFSLTFLIGFVSLFSSHSLKCQSIKLTKINQYSFFTQNNATEPIHTDAKALFVNSTNKIYFNLTPVKPGLSTSVVLGKIFEEQVTFLDTVDSAAFPDELIDYHIDNEENIIFAVNGSSVKVVRKLSSNGTELWSTYYSEDTINTPWYIHLSDDQNPLVLFRRIYPDTTYSTVAQKINTTDGSVLWENEFAKPPNGYFLPSKVREIDGHYQIFSSNNNSILITQLNQDGGLLHQAQGNNPMQEDIFDYIHIDSEGFSYPGVNAWGYQLPKININADSVWYYEKPSPFGDETTNRTTSIHTDADLNVFIGGPFRLEPKANFSLMLTKLNKQGDLLWESLTHNIENSEKYFYPQNSFIYRNNICFVGSTYDSLNNLSGALYSFDMLNGQLLMNHEFEELTPDGYATFLDFHDDDLLITGSTGAYPDSIFQHILHYRLDSVSATQNLPNQILVSPYPNPTADYISIKDVNIQQIDQFSITDVQGKRVNEQAVILDSGSIDLSRLANGIYFLTYFINNQQYKAKILKQ